MLERSSLFFREFKLGFDGSGQFAPQIERAENGSKRVNRFGRLASSSNRIRQFLFARCRAFFLILHNGTLVPIQPPLFVHCENN